MKTIILILGLCGAANAGTLVTSQEVSTNTVLTTASTQTITAQKTFLNGAQMASTAGQMFLNYYSTQTVTLAATGFTVGVNLDTRMTRTGNMVCYLIPSWGVKTKNGSGRITIAAMPTAYRPTGTITQIVSMVLGATWSQVFSRVNTDGTTEFFWDIQANNIPDSLNYQPTGDFSYCYNL
jgi:hypothetical protein